MCTTSPQQDVLTQPERNQLVTANLGLVTRNVTEIAYRFPRHVDRGELWNAGALGLVEASRRFNPAYGVPFSRYAAIRIRGAIIDSTRTPDWVTRSLRRQIREVQSTALLLEEEAVSAPTDNELARALGISTTELAARRADAFTSTVLRLDRSEPDKDPLGYFVEERRVEFLPEPSLERREMNGTLATAIRHLSAVQAQVITRHDLQGDMLKDIATDLGVTEARVSQIRSEAVASMRSYFAAIYEGLNPTPDTAPGKRARTTYVSRAVAQSTWHSRIEAAEDLNIATPKSAAV